MMPHTLFEEGGGSPHADTYVARASHFLFLDYILYLLKYQIAPQSI
jgi:hypothetical protein